MTTTTPPVNVDTTVDPEALAALVELMERFPKTAVAAIEKARVLGPWMSYRDPEWPNEEEDSSYRTSLGDCQQAQVGVYDSEDGTFRVGNSALQVFVPLPEAPDCDLPRNEYAALHALYVAAYNAAWLEAERQVDVKFYAQGWRFYGAPPKPPKKQKSAP